MAGVKAGSVRAGEAVAGVAVAGQTHLNYGTIYSTPIYSQQLAQVDLGALSMISVGDTAAVIGGNDAYIGRQTDSYIYVNAQDWANPNAFTQQSAQSVSYTKTS